MTDAARMAAFFAARSKRDAILAEMWRNIADQPEVRPIGRVKCD